MQAPLASLPAQLPKMIQTSAAAAHSAAHAIHSSSTEVTTSPFRQTEWDCRLDHLLQDLETSVGQRSQSSERSSTTHKVQIEVEPTADNNNTAGYASVITRSKSASSIDKEAGPETGNMLKDLDTALKASTNYIESHRSTALPNGGHQEYHEYRSTTTSGTPRTAAAGGDDFNLERQVNIESCKNVGLKTSCFIFV